MLARALLINVLALLVYMSIWFLAAKKRGRLDTVDMAWGPAFILVAWAALIQNGAAPNYLIAVLVTIWGVRLARHLFKRILNSPEDKRYREISRKWKGNFWLRAYFSIFLIQALLVWIISLPVAAATSKQIYGNQLAIIGTAVWLAGYIFESIADRQLAVFLRSSSKGQVMNRGLWRYSRHPNYFGEITQWFGIAIIASVASFGWVGLIGPVFLSLLIIFVSGVPLIEKPRQKDKAYQAYKNRTSMLVPLPPKNRK